MYLTGSYQELEFYLNYIRKKKMDYAIFTREGDIFILTDSGHPVYLRSNLKILKDVVIDHKSAMELLENLQIAKDGMDATSKARTLLLYTGDVISIEPDGIIFDQQEEFKFNCSVRYEHANNDFIRRLEKYKETLEYKAKHMNPQITLLLFNVDHFISRIIRSKEKFGVRNDKVFPSIEKLIYKENKEEKSIELILEKTGEVLRDLPTSWTNRLSEKEVVPLNCRLLGEAFELLRVIRGERITITPTETDLIIAESFNPLNEDELILRMVLSKKTLSL